MNTDPKKKAVAPPTPDSSSPKKGQDVVVVQGMTPDREGLVVVRAKDHRLEVGEVRPVKEGQPLTSELVRLTPRPEAPFICDVETQYSPQDATPRGSSSSTDSARKPGPAQVATQAYRDNWDAIWSRTPVTAPGSSELN